jgi:hypothetical protein
MRLCILRLATVHITVTVHAVPDMGARLATFNVQRARQSKRASPCTPCCVTPSTAVPKGEKRRVEASAARGERVGMLAGRRVAVGGCRMALCCQP